jgi:hypothetical protein
MLSFVPPCALILEAETERASALNMDLSVPVISTESAELRFEPLIITGELITPPIATSPKSIDSPSIGAVNSASPVIGGVTVPSWSLI